MGFTLFLTVALCFLLQIHLIVCLLFIFLPISSSTFPVSASHILGMQIWICKCYGKRRSRCVTARTESGQHGRTDMPCMQVKLVYNMAPRGHHTRVWSFNGWIPDSSPGTSEKTTVGHSRQENYASDFFFVRFPVSQTTCQATLYGYELNLRDNWNWGQKCDLFSAT